MKKKNSQSPFFFQKRSSLLIAKHKSLSPSLPNTQNFWDSRAISEKENCPTDRFCLQPLEQKIVGQ